MNLLSIQNPPKNLHYTALSLFLTTHSLDENSQINRIDKISLHADWAKNMLVTKTEEMLHITFKQSDSNEQKPTNLKV